MKGGKSKKRQKKWQIFCYFIFIRYLCTRKKSKTEMNIFLTGTPFETAEALDKKRLNSQIREAGWILASFEQNGTRLNHPIAKMYKEHIEFVRLYRACLIEYREKNFQKADALSEEAMKIVPDFVTDEYILNMRRRLYTKAPELYPQFKKYGTSYMNLYFVDGEWKRYEQKIDSNILI